MAKKVKFKNYSTELKIGVIIDMRGHRLSYHKTVRKNELDNNLKHRDFYADKQFDKLTTDVTELKIGDEKV